LKSEISNTSPTTQNRGSSSQSSNPTSSTIKNTAPAPTEGDGDGSKSKGGDGKGHQTLRQKKMQKLEENPSQLGDPVSFKAEKADSRPTDQDTGAKGGKSKL
jgi:hypothetical protein